MSPSVRVSSFAGVLAAAALVSLGHTAAHAATVTCAPDLVTEQGTCAQPVGEPAPTQFQLDQAREKQARVASYERQLRAAAPKSGLATPMSTNDPGGGPDAYVIPEVASMRIFKEGEGNGKKSYTCGPSATRNMVAAMYKRRDGVYKDFGEAQFAAWEGTTTSGTARANIASALNAHFGSFGHWTTSRPADPASLLATVKSDTSVYHQSVVANIDTEYLGFWNGAKFDHFDLIYGFDATGATSDLKYAEEWDPVYIYGHTFSYGNPYGLRHASLQSSFTAITHTSIHGIVS